MLRPILEFVAKESDDEEHIYLCIVPAGAKRIHLNPEERKFLSRLLPPSVDEMDVGLWHSENTNIVNRIMVPGVCYGQTNSHAQALMDWYIEEKRIDADEDDDDDDDEGFWYQP